MWGFKKPVGSVPDQERGPGCSTVTRPPTQALGARAQWCQGGLSRLTAILSSAFPGGDTGPRGRISSAPENGGKVAANSACSLEEMSMPQAGRLGWQPVLASELWVEMEDHQHCCLYLCLILRWPLRVPSLVLN